MYSESDIEAAVASGAMSAEAAAALRASVATARAAPSVDEESFRLITGFNDIFVSIAAILLLVAIGWIGSACTAVLLPEPPLSDVGIDFSRRMAGSSLLAGAPVAVASWLLAEYFTRRRRMALPSILLLATFALGTAAATGGLAELVVPSGGERGRSLISAFAALCTGGAIYFHWLRFHVPITVAALTGAAVVTVLSLFFAMVPGTLAGWLWMLLLAGLCVFGFAMWWDMSDRTRQTRRADVAFWLHLSAAPMIAHPVFNLLGVMSGTIGVGTALAVILLYIGFGIVALAVDRRALLVSSLFYVLYALAGLFDRAGAVSLSIAFTALVIGSALLLLSAFWAGMRRQVVERLPSTLRDRLPALDRPALNPRPA